MLTPDEIRQLFSRVENLIDQLEHLYDAEDRSVVRIAERIDVLIGRLLHDLPAVDQATAAAVLGVPTDDPMVDIFAIADNQVPLHALFLAAGAVATTGESALLARISADEGRTAVRTALGGTPRSGWRGAQIPAQPSS
jgi:hypothetical protein